MKELNGKLVSWVVDGEAFVLATVIRTWGSAPRKAGSHMAVNRTGEMIGSVSGGCVENDVVRLASEVIRTGKGRFQEYGVSDDQAWNVGLSCGGQIQILLSPFFCSGRDADDRHFWDAVLGSVNHNEGGVIEYAIDGSMVKFSSRSALGTQQIYQEAYDQRVHRLFPIEEPTAFLEVVTPKPAMLIIGAAHVTTDLVQLGQQFGFEAIVVDPRGFFAEKTLFPIKPDKLYNAWPEEVLNGLDLGPYTFAVTLSHQPEIDDQALRILLQSNVAYIGALGSRKTHQKRIDRLKAAGFADTAIARIHGPVGIDINAMTPKEIALSIISQIIQVKNQYR